MAGIGDLGELTRRKRVRWAASVYGRYEPELRTRAERILREELGEEVKLVWRTGVMESGFGGEPEDMVG